jgi:hypothetical protein
MYELANQILRGRLDAELVRLRLRGDTWEDIMFWLRTKGIRVSRPTVTEWGNAALEKHDARRVS